MHGILTHKQIRYENKNINSRRAIFRFFKGFFFENIRRKLVRVLKLYREFILTKNGDINPQKIKSCLIVPKGDFADMCTEQFPIGGQSEGLACADPVARTPIGMSRIFIP